MANISTENINTLAQLASSIGDGDYIYIYKGSSHSFARIERSVLLDGAGGGSADISELISNDWTDTSRAHRSIAPQKVVHLTRIIIILLLNYLIISVYGKIANASSCPYY